MNSNISINANRTYQINNLESGVEVYVRVSCANIKGFSETVPSEPEFAVPNTWREGYSIYEKIYQNVFKLNDLNTQLTKEKLELDSRVSNRN